jgi:hypothetical protein
MTVAVPRPERPIRALPAVYLEHVAMLPKRLQIAIKRAKPA